MPSTPTPTPHSHAGAPQMPGPSGVVVLSEVDEESGDPAKGGTVVANMPYMQIGGYELIAEIARGGMGKVFLCRRCGESGFRRLFALKVMHPHLAEQSEFIAMLLDEARLASTLHHPNVVAVVDLGRDDAGLYLVMDYVEGCSLSQLLKRLEDHRPPELLVPLLVDALQGLHAAHVQEDDAGMPLNLVHRDVSPQNILVGVDGIARIADFGIAKARARLTMTDAGVRKGKLAYMAPEQLSEEESLDARADVFAAGAMMWSALTGRRLFLADNEAATVLNVMSKPVPPPSTVGAQPPACLDAICLKALERDRTRRYGSALEMANELREVAMANDLWAPPDRIGAMVKEAFATELADRRRAVRLASQRSAISGPSQAGLEIETPVSYTVSEKASGGDGATSVVMASPPPKRSSLAPVAAVALVLLLGGGAGAWWTFGDREPAAGDEPHAPAVDAKPPGDGADAQGATVPSTVSSPLPSAPPPSASPPSEPKPSSDEARPESGVVEEPAAPAAAAESAPARPRTSNKKKSRASERSESPATPGPSRPPAREAPTEDIEPNPYR